MKTKYFDIAKRLADKSQYFHKLGCVVVKKNKAIGFGYNKPHKTHPRSTTKFRTTHAELDAIIGLSYTDLSGAEVYVYRQLKNGTPAMAKPCQHCMELLKLANVSKVYYTSEKGFESYELAPNI